MDKILYDMKKDIIRIVLKKKDIFKRSDFFRRPIDFGQIAPTIPNT